MFFSTQFKVVVKRVQYSLIKMIQALFIPTLAQFTPPSHPKQSVAPSVCT